MSFFATMWQQIHLKEDVLPPNTDDGLTKEVWPGVTLALRTLGSETKYLDKFGILTKSLY